MKTTFKVYFYLKGDKNLPAGSCVPIMGRVSVNGSQPKQFTTQMKVAPEHWNQKFQRVERTYGSVAKVNEMNNRLAFINAKLQEVCDEMHKYNPYVTAEKVKNTYLGHPVYEHTLMKLWEEHLQEKKRQVKIKISEATYQKICRNYAHLKTFLTEEYRRSDFSLPEINTAFLSKYEFYLRTHGCNHNTATKYMQGLHTIFINAIKDGLIVTDPFSSYDIKLEPVDRGYLTMSELQTIMNRKFSCERLTHVRDIFVFSCFTGLAYIDAKKLKKEEIQERFDGRPWIVTKRGKTGTDVKIPLLDVPLAILEKYKHTAESSKSSKPLLPVLSNQKMNAYLKEIGDLCGIEKNLTFHLARHTFATTITLTNGVPMETVSKMLGHTNLKTTQIYARVINEKTRNDMAALASKLGEIKMAL